MPSAARGVACGQRRQGRRRPSYGPRHVRRRRARTRHARSCPATPWRRGWAGAARARSGVRCRAAAGRRWRSRCWSPATRSGRPARRRCWASSTTRTWSGCSRWCTSRGAAGRPRVALVLDLLAGGSLAALLARRGRLRPGEVVTAIAPVAAALAHAHANGVVHGDLSPGNIVFTAEGRPVLTDLGVARVLGETSAGEVTPAYVDPTVARGGAPGPASDVFGVAAAAFHALTGIAPWNAATPADTLRVAADGLLPDLAELAPEAPPELLRGRSAGVWPPTRTTGGSAAAFALDLRHACRPEPVRLPQDGVPGRRAGRHRPRAAHRAHAPGAGPAPAPARRWCRSRPGAGEPAARSGRSPAVGCPARPAGRRRALVVVLAVSGVGWIALGSAGVAGRRRRRSPRASATRPARRRTRGDRLATADAGRRVDGAGATVVRPGCTSGGPRPSRTPSPELLDDVYAERQRAAGRRRRARVDRWRRRGEALRGLRARRSSEVTAARGRRRPGAARPGRRLGRLRGRVRRRSRRAPALRQAPGHGRPPAVRMVLVRTGRRAGGSRAPSGGR